MDPCQCFIPHPLLPRRCPAILFDTLSSHITSQIKSYRIKSRLQWIFPFIAASKHCFCSSKAGAIQSPVSSFLPSTPPPSLVFLPVSSSTLPTTRIHLHSFSQSFSPIITGIQILNLKWTDIFLNTGNFSIDPAWQNKKVSNICEGGACGRIPQLPRCRCHVWMHRPFSVKCVISWLPAFPGARQHPPSVSKSIRIWCSGCGERKHHCDAATRAPCYKHTLWTPLKHVWPCSECAVLFAASHHHRPYR